MMRGPTYDDGYITRKMSSMHGPTFAPPPGVGSYGRPPMGGYMQRQEKKEEKETCTAIELKESEERKKRRAVSPSIPYFWPEKETSNMDRKKGWYRVDFGPQRTTQMWYLPTVRDRLNFLNRHKDSNPHEPFETPSPFPVEEDTKPRSSEYWKVQRQMFPSTTRDQRKSKPLICLGNLPLSKPRFRGSSMAPSPYSQIPRPGLVPSISYTPARSLSQPPMGAANAPGRVTSYWSGYPMGPPPRMVPRMGPPPPSYYDYDYGYGGGYGGYGGYGYGYPPPPPPPRMSRYDTYLDDELPEHYSPRHRTRIPDTMDDMDIRDKGTPHHHQALVPMPPPSVAALRDLPPMSVNDVDDSYLEQPRRMRKAHLQSSPGIEPPHHLHVPGETEGDRHLAKMQARYPSLSEPQMLQDHVDKMRIRLKSIAFSLDPSGPVPDIIVPERRKPGAAADADKAYSKAMEFSDLPKLASRRQRYYPEDEYLKDNLRIKCLSHYKTTRTAADYWKPKQYNPDDFKVPSDTSSRYDKLAGAKWEEPDTVFGAPSSDKKPYSKVESGSSFFSTYGYTARKKDYLAEKVRDYYYFGDEAKPLTDGTSEESDERKERRKKKKSKERELPETLALESSTPAPLATTPAPTSELSTSEVESAAKEVSSITEDMDEKELKKLEKKKRKAEREAAAKAAMEAELAALAAAEAELARLEAESSTLKTDSPAPAPVEVPAKIEVPSPAPAAAEESTPTPTPAPAEPATEVKSESAADKCESSTEVVCEGVSVTPESLGELPPSESPLQVPPQDEQIPVEVEEPPKMMEEPRVEFPEEVPQVEFQTEVPQVESQCEVLQEESQAEIPQMEPYTEEPPKEPLVEDVPVEISLEEAKEEQPQEELQVEQPQPELQVECHVDEIQGETRYTPTNVEPQAEPQVDEPSVVSPMEEVTPTIVDDGAVVEENVKEPECEVPADGDFWSQVAPADGSADDIG
ncbi:uncharacterized protein [Palaemon carinicauda]|uniref:uncharacterized protein isoform X7 n=1 Tax=Palaemon carinicauda TaxID=392227 RepID=UPI0035B6175A